MRRYWNALTLAALVLVLTACDLRLATEIILESDHSGQLIVSLALDEETAVDLVAAGFVPEAGLAEALGEAPGWEVTTIRGLSAGVRLSRRFDHVREVGPLLEELGEQWGPQDGALWDGLRLQVDPSGDVILDGRAGLIPPSVVGGEGEGVTFDGEDLARLLAQDGGEAVHFDLRVTSPGRPGPNDADVFIDHALVWELPVGRMRSVNAVLRVDRDTNLARLAAVAVFVAAGTSVVTILTRRRAVGR